MNDLISRKALLAEYDRVHIGEPGKARKLMEDAPTIDAVPVVRCKDCRYFYRDDEFNRAWCGYDKCVANEVAVNGYCYRGERKDNERKAE